MRRVQQASTHLSARKIQETLDVHVIRAENQFEEKLLVHLDTETQTNTINK
jgi:hypothetical protein